MNNEIIFKNKFCTLCFKGTLIILSSNLNRYNNIYFTSLENARIYVNKLGIKI